MNNSKIGFIQLVRAGKLTAREAFDALTILAKGSWLTDPKLGLAVFKGSHAYRWLSRRLHNA